MSKSKKAPQAVQTNLFDNKKLVVVDVIPVVEKQMNDHQCRQFTYMLDRMESWRIKTIREATRLATKTAESDVGDYTIDQFFKDLKSGKIKPETLSRGRKITVNSETNNIQVGDKFESRTCDTVVFHFHELYFKSEHREKLKELAEAEKVSIKEVNDCTAFYRIRLRTGGMSNTEANLIIEKLMDMWKVPVTIVAEANASNKGCSL